MNYSYTGDDRLHVGSHVLVARYTRLLLAPRHARLALLLAGCKALIVSADRPQISGTGQPSRLAYVLIQASHARASRSVELLAGRRRTPLSAFKGARSPRLREPGHLAAA